MSCGCAQEKGATPRDNGGTETVTLFEKCPKQSGPGRDIMEYATRATPGNEDKDDWSAAQYLKPDTDDNTCTTAKEPANVSLSSSSSARTYKFVSPRECYCLGRDEGEEARVPPVSFEPCVTAGREEPEEPDVECTLAIIKPEAVAHRRRIEQRIFEEGFEVYRTRWLQLTPEQASEFYTDCYGRPNFAHLVAYMASGPIVALVLAKRDAVKDWRSVMGPTKVAEARLYFPDSVRARYGRKGEDFKNAVHGSVSREQAEREIHFFFPEFVIEPLLKGEMASDFLWDVVNPVLVEGLSLCCKRKPADPILWLAHWLILNNPNKPRLPEDIALIPT